MEPDVFERSRQKMRERRNVVRAQNWRQILRRYLYILWSPIPRFLYCAGILMFFVGLLTPASPKEILFFSLVPSFVGFWFGSFAFLYNVGILPTFMGDEPSALWVNYDGKGYPLVDMEYTGYPHLP